MPAVATVQVINGEKVQAALFCMASSIRGLPQSWSFQLTSQLTLLPQKLGTSL